MRRRARQKCRTRSHQRALRFTGQRATALSRLAPGLDHESDLGSIYACPAYEAALARHDARLITGRCRVCFGNAVVESLVATVALGLVNRPTWATGTNPTGVLADYRDGRDIWDGGTRTSTV